MKNLFFFLFLTVLSAAVATAAGVTVTWDKNPDADYYQVYAAKPDTPGNFELISGQLTDNLFEITGLPKDTAHLISVKAFNAWGNSSDFSDAILVTDHTLVTINTNRTGKTLTWDSYPIKTGISGFSLTYSPKAAPVIISDVNATSFDLCTLQLDPDVPYSVTISAIGLSGTQVGPQSTPIVFTNHTPVKITGVKIQ